MTLKPEPAHGNAGPLWYANIDTLFRPDLYQYVIIVGSKMALLWQWIGAKSLMTDFTSLTPLYKI